MNIEECKKYIAARGSVSIAFKQMLAVAELDIVNFCNLKCKSCNRFMDVAQSKDMMSLSQVKFFVDESISLSWPWKELRIMGGEPTLHPQFKEILDEMVRLKEFNPSIHIKVITNGTGKLVKEKLKLVPSSIQIMNSEARYKNQGDVIHDYGNVWQAPIDRVSHVESCKIHNTCGLGVSHLGILPCGCGNAIARVVGLDFFFKSLSEVSVERCNERLKVLCALCGRNLNYPMSISNNDSKSEFWEQILGGDNESK